MKCNVYLLVKTAPCELEGCPTFGVQFRVCSGFQTTFGLGEPYSVTVLRMRLFRIGECVSHFGELCFAADTSARIVEYDLDCAVSFGNEDAQRQLQGEGGVFCISGVPALGVPKTMTFAGCMSNHFVALRLGGR